MHQLLIFSILLCVQLFAQEYELGQGVKVPNIPLYIGGYTTIDYLKRKDDYNRARIDDIALLGYGSVERLSYLLELEMKESYVKEWGEADSKEHNNRVNTERLYLNYDFSDILGIRAGKFNTPVGYWNLEPINVLRDSASNPYLANIIYPRYTTGILVNYADTLHTNSIYTLQIQHNNDLDDEYNNISIARHYSGGFEHFFSDLLSLKTNLGYFRTTDNQSFYYGVFALQYEREKYKISSEFGTRRSHKTWSVPYAFYMQGVWHVKEHHDLIGRFEHYKIDEGAARDEQIGIFGYTYRPVYPVALKAEYQLHSYTNENQYTLSFSVMF